MQQHRDDDRHASKPEPTIPPRGGHLWLPEVHAIDARDKREREKYGSDDSQHLHYFVQFEADAREIDVENARNDAPERLDDIDRVDGVVVHVPEVGACSL